jgi:3-hydroxyacyl-[acyl-carrier-protein] dehydratase
MSGELPSPKQFLPHREPFLFIDSLTFVNPGVSAKGLWQLKGDEWFFPGHFPGRPTLPGVLMCEAIAQMGGVAVLSSSEYDGKLALFGGLDGARFRRQVVPGDTLELEAEIHRMSGRGGKGAGRAILNGKVACECDLMLVLVDA